MTKEYRGGKRKDGIGGTTDYKTTLTAITKKIKKLKNERVFFVDMQTGEIYKMLQGKGDEVVTPPEVVREMARRIYDSNRQIAFIHNHPSGSTLSGADATALARRNYMAMVAVANGKTYILAPKKSAVSMQLGIKAEEYETKVTTESWKKSNEAVRGMQFQTFKEKQAYKDKWEIEYIFKKMHNGYKRNASKYGAVYRVIDN